jgi:hypothetical protein
LILEFLDGESLKKFLLMSKELRRLVMTSPRLMAKLPVIFCMGNWRDKLPFVERYGELVKSVIFENCEVESLEEVVDTLKMTPNIETLELFMSHQREEKIVSKLPTHQLNKLRNLTFNGHETCVKEILKTFEACTSLETFNVSNCFSSPFKTISSFVSQQRNLKEFSIKGSYYNNFAVESVFTESFMQSQTLKLRKLSFQCGLTYDERLAKFLETQANSVESLELHGNYIDFHYFRIVFQKFEKLKELKLNCNSFWSNERVEESRNFQLAKVERLEIEEHFEDVSGVHALLSIFPNLEVLTMNLEHPLHGIIEKLPKLRKIKADIFRLEMMIEAKSSSLKELEISLRYPMALSFLWENLAQNCPNIEKLIIREIAAGQLMETTNQVAVILKNLKNFRNLKVCLLENKAPTRWMISEDRGVLNDTNFNLTFKLVMERNLDGSVELEASRYFEENHQAALQDIRRR